ncbi:hypothetical protein L6164_011312 [Bauhinia variegata]|uniref:Uncharacterized protein n=1 Tax=Bauhinia variegata TaxID=167791 RepID=A0ACB9P5J4_BAUVA|nr:hypothetical protein L6164_011312 [Bauhinia variegata]
MAILFKGSNPQFLCSILLFACSNMFLVTCTEFEVGGKDGWAIPSGKNDDQMYNQWASKNRFKVDDTVRFKYEKDSVMVVTAEEYENCKSSRPLFFSNNGDTIFKFDRSGLFYFISGVAGHCDRGQKMIIKVLELEAAHAHAPQSQSANENATTKAHVKGEAAAQMIPSFKTTVALSVLPLLGLLFVSN